MVLARYIKGRISRPTDYFVVHTRRAHQLKWNANEIDCDLQIEWFLQLGNPAVYFEIPVTDMKRATTFLFGFDFKFENRHASSLQVLAQSRKLQLKLINQYLY